MEHNDFDANCIVYIQKVTKKVKFNFLQHQISIFQLQISIKFGVLKYKDEAMSTQMETDEGKYDKLAVTLFKRKAEREAAAELKRVVAKELEDRLLAATQQLKDNYNRLATLRARGRAERQAAAGPTDLTTPTDLQDGTTQLEYMRACLCNI